MKTNFLTLLCLLMMLEMNNTHAQRITTVAGTGAVSGYSGDGGPATAAKLVYVNGVVIDDHGFMYITVDGNFPNIRRVDTAGIITTIAGKIGNVRGFSGDGGPATAAKISDPRGIAFDKKGNVYFFDEDSSRIRKIDAAGIITTVAGNGAATPSGDGGPATTAGLGGGGGGLCIDPTGNIYLSAGHFIRRVDTVGIISTIAGTGVAGYSGDGGMASAAQIGTNSRQIAIDKYGNLFFGDGARIRKINTAGIITTFAGNGTNIYTSDGSPATSVGINPFGVFPDSNGNVYIADREPAHRIRKVNPAGIITTIAGSGTDPGYSGDGGPGTAAKLCWPYVLCMGKNNCLYIADFKNYCVRRLDLNDSVFVSVPGVVQNEDVVKVYPNPAGDGVFTVRVSTLADEQVQVVVTDVTGTRVHELTTATNKETNISLHVPPGMYLVQIATADKQWVKKILVE
ncbi:MAG: Leucinerich repeat protein-like protein [Flavipsychrobacter sp.]|jgi:hypothetical protein|nr:Leucinerich repeat protein-like protein [Flavipsychrobacter sp.]